MKCRACEEDKDLIRAHIIPHFFYRDLRAESKYLEVVPSQSSKRVRKSPVGEYDQTILCKECDQYLGKFDNYGKEVLIDNIYPFEKISEFGAVAGWSITGCDPVRLKKFFLSILWRASISNRVFFNKVKLGPYEKIIKNYLWNQDSKNDSLGCVIAKFQASQIAYKAEKTILDPDRLKYKGINYYRLYFGGYVIWMRVDHRKPNDSVGRCELSDTGQSIIINRAFDTSKEFQLIQKGVFVHSNKK